MDRPSDDAEASGEHDAFLVMQGFRYELDPNNVQRGLLSRHAGTARFAYN